MPTVIEAQGLGKRYGTHHRHRWALADCTLHIPAGHIAGLVGPNRDLRRPGPRPGRVLGLVDPPPPPGLTGSTDTRCQ